MSLINKIIVSLLCIILAGLLVAGFARRRHTQELAASINALSSFDSGIALIGTDISDLYEAENNFRLYAATYDNTYFLKYYQGLKKIRLSISSLQKNYAQPAKGFNDLTSLNNTLAKKLVINKMIVDLRRSVDSALTAAIQLDTTAQSDTAKKVSAVIPYYKVPSEKIHRRDTVITSQKTSKRKGLLHRVKAALSGTNDKDTITISRLSDTYIQRDSALLMINRAVGAVEDYYRKNLNRQWTARNNLNAKDSELLGLNASLIGSLNRILHSFQLRQQNDEDLNKKRALSVADHSSGQLALIGSISFAVIILLLLLTLYNIYRVNSQTKKLVIAKQEAEKNLMAKSNLLASVSHEIRNPLTVIRGLTELLQDSDLPDPQREQLTTIGSASDMLLSTVNDILDFSKLEAKKMFILPEPLQPAALAEEVAAVMRSLAERKGLQLQLDTCQLTPHLNVLGDAFRLKQVLFNLVGNAIKFTREGQVKIKVADSPADTPKQTILCFEISDTGIGIPADKLQNVFNEYEQVRQSGSSPAGTGLGLAICKKIVLLHGGSIEVSSDTGKGAVFSVKIKVDVIPGNEAPSREEVLPATVALLKNKKILLVDDNPVVAQLAKLFLGKQEANVIVADDGTHAWDLFRGHSFDMVITDIHLPGISGLTLATNIRSFPHPERSSIPILALTGDAFEQQTAAYTAAGIDDAIIKPFTRKGFLEKVGRHFII
jgi:signal transduction histidine kinase/CheY-like chemotaxis protein